MYKGFKSLRHYVNAHIYQYALLIAGGSRSTAKELIDNIIEQNFPPQKSPDGLTPAVPNPYQTNPRFPEVPPTAPREHMPSDLTGRSSEPSGHSLSALDDEQANLIFGKIRSLFFGQKRFVKKVGITNTYEYCSDKQRKAIIRITKYKLRWSPEATFSYILDTFPHKRKRLNSFEIQSSKLSKLFSILSKDDASKLIKRLDKLQLKNQTHIKS
jgi:hypothetical protein